MPNSLSRTNALDTKNTTQSPKSSSFIAFVHPRQSHTLLSIHDPSACYWCFVLQFQIHDASVKVKNTAVHLEVLLQSLNFNAHQFLLLCQGSAVNNVRWLLDQMIVSADVGMCPSCKLLNSFSCQNFRRTSAIFHKYLEILTTPLWWDWLTAIIQLCMGPTVIHSFTRLLSIEFKGEEVLRCWGAVSSSWKSTHFARRCWS